MSYAAAYPEKVRSLSLHSTWPRSDAFLQTVVASWQVVAEALDDVRETAITAIFPWCFTPERYGEQPEFIQAIVDFARSRPKQLRKVGSSILAEAQRRGLVGQNAASGTAVTRPSRDRARVAIPAKAELRHMLENASADFRPMLLTAMLTGMRASELRGLGWAQVDLKGGTISVVRRVDLWGSFGSPKSGAGHRTIPIPLALVSELREWKLRCPKGPLDLAFPNGVGGVLDHTNMLRRRYLPTQEGLTRRYGFHALRHAAASAWIRQGVDLKRVGSWLGHSSVALTVDRYGHLIVDTAGGAAIVRRAADELLG